MKRAFAAGFAIAAVVMLAAAPGFARPGRGWNNCRGGGWAGQAYGQQTGSANQETLSGVVSSLDKATPMRGRGAGVHFTLKTDVGPVVVLLGPDWFLEKSATKLATGDTVEIKGSRMNYRNEQAVAATQVKRGSDLLVLRYDNGVPLWAGWRR